MSAFFHHTFDAASNSSGGGGAGSQQDSPHSTNTSSSWSPGVGSQPSTSSESDAIQLESTFIAVANDPIAIRSLGWLAYSVLRRQLPSEQLLFWGDMQCGDDELALRLQAFSIMHQALHVVRRSVHEATLLPEPINAQLHATPDVLGVICNEADPATATVALQNHPAFPGVIDFLIQGCKFFIYLGEMAALPQHLNVYTFQRAVLAQTDDSLALVRALGSGANGGKVLLLVPGLGNSSEWLRPLRFPVLACSLASEANTASVRGPQIHDIRSTFPNEPPGPAVPSGLAPGPAWINEILRQRLFSPAETRASIAPVKHVACHVCGTAVPIESSYQGQCGHEVCMLCCQLVAAIQYHSSAASQCVCPVAACPQNFSLPADRDLIDHLLTAAKAKHPELRSDLGNTVVLGEKRLRPSTKPRCAVCLQESPSPVVHTSCHASVCYICTVHWEILRRQNLSSASVPRACPGAPCGCMEWTPALKALLRCLCSPNVLGYICHGPTGPGGPQAPTTARDQLLG